MQQRTPGFLLAIASSLALVGPSLAATTNHKPHVHGAAKLVLAIETPIQASIELDVPADSIYGFEHPARTTQDKKIQEAGLRKLRDGAAKVILFDAALSCVVTVKSVGLEKEEDHESQGTSAQTGEHADVNASYLVVCAHPLPGSKVEIGLIGMFEKIKSVSFQVLSDTGQAETKVENGHQDITL